MKIPLSVDSQKRATAKDERAGEYCAIENEIDRNCKTRVKRTFIATFFFRISSTFKILLTFLQFFFEKKIFNKKILKLVLFLVFLKLFFLKLVSIHCGRRIERTLNVSSS